MNRNIITINVLFLLLCVSPIYADIINVNDNFGGEIGFGNGGYLNGFFNITPGLSGSGFSLNDVQSGTATFFFRDNIGDPLYFNSLSHGLYTYNPIDDYYYRDSTRELTNQIEIASASLRLQNTNIMHQTESQSSGSSPTTNTHGPYGDSTVFNGGLVTPGDWRGSRLGYTTYTDNVDGFTGLFSITMGLDSDSLTDLLQDGILQYRVNSLANTFVFTNAQLSLEAENAPAPVPEPATMLLFGTGLAGLAGLPRRKKKLCN